MSDQVYLSGSIPTENHTLFLTGLPDDVKERELRNLFRFHPGFLGSILQLKKSKFAKGDKSPTHYMAFVLFDSEQSAQEVKESLGGTRFDYHDPASPTLKLFFAKKNLVLPRHHSQAISRRLNSSFTIGNPFYGLGSYPITAFQQQMPQMNQMNQMNQMSQMSQMNEMSQMAQMNQMGQLTQLQLPQLPQSSALPSARSNSKRKIEIEHIKLPEGAVSTLFCSNILDIVSSEELRSLFGTRPGYHDMTISRKNGRAFAFVEFSTPYYATQAMNAMSGYRLVTAPCQMKVEYSSSPFRRRKKRKVWKETKVTHTNQAQSTNRLQDINQVHDINQIDDTEQLQESEGMLDGTEQLHERGDGTGQLQERGDGTGQLQERGDGTGQLQEREGMLNLNQAQNINHVQNQNRL